MLDDFHPIEYKDKLLWSIPRLWFFDKVAGGMSALIDAAVVLIDHYQKSAEESWDHHTHWLGPWIH
jgi:hypothetical protein